MPDVLLVGRTEGERLAAAFASEQRQQMMCKSPLGPAACLCFALAAASPPLRAELKPEDLYSTVLPSIVTLDVESVSGKRFVGSGFLTVGKGMTVTAWHVVHDARRVEARFSDHRPVKVLGLVDKNEALDLALLQLESGDRPQLRLNLDAPRIGSRVYIIGSPRGFDFSISEGLISQIRTLEGVRYYQLSCPISPGDSGGPVVNGLGEVLGVVSWRKADAESLGFAVPSAGVGALNPASRAIAFSETPTPTPASPNRTSQVLLDRSRAAIGEESSTRNYAEFQQFLADRAGKRLTVLVKEPGKETRFSFEVPQEAVK